MRSPNAGPLGWPRRKVRAFITWAMWSRQRFLTVLVTATALIALALTIAITGIALSVQSAVGEGSPQPVPTTPIDASPSTDWVTRDKFGNEKVTATTTLAIPPASAGPQAAARNFATHWLRGAHLEDYSDDRKRWVGELRPLMQPGGDYFLRESRQASFPVASIVNATTVERIPGLPGGPVVTTFDLSDASILVVETQREYGGKAWLVSDYRYRK